MKKQPWKKVKGNSFCLSGTAHDKFFHSLVAVKLSAILLLVLLQNFSTRADASSQTNGYITAVLRGECTDAPPSPPPVGAIRVGPNYVIMTVGVGDPADWQRAQQLVTDGVFESLMPLYCALSANPEAVCLENRVQWSVELYDAAGNPRVSGCAASGCELHNFSSPCSASAPEQIQFLMTWVNVDVTAAVLGPRAGDRLMNELSAALESASNRKTAATAHKIKTFIQEVNGDVRAGRLSEAAAQTLINGAGAVITELGGQA